MQFCYTLVMPKIESGNFKNDITIEQLLLSCKHVVEMREAGVTMNRAIRTLEFFADVYAKILKGGSRTPNHVDQVALWSIKARKLRLQNPVVKPRDHFIVEHGTPRRGFALMVLKLYQTGKLNKKSMGRLVNKYWRLAVITLEEDARLNKIARTEIFHTPDERWACAGIKFPKQV
jgi:hypothetical protein